MLTGSGALSQEASAAAPSSTTARTGSQESAQAGHMGHRPGQEQLRQAGGSSSAFAAADVQQGPAGRLRGLEGELDRARGRAEEAEGQLAEARQQLAAALQVCCLATFSL